MGNDQTWTVVATPRERYWLAQLLIHKDAKWKTDEQVQQLNRFRRALGLVAPTSGFLDSKGMTEPPSSKDRKTRNAFQVTRENADFIRKTLEKFDKNGVELFYVGEVLEQLAEHKTIAPDAETAPPVDPSKEDWDAPLPPILSPPEPFAFAFLRIVQENESYGRFRQAYIEAMKVGEKKAEEPAAEEAEPEREDEAA